MARQGINENGNVALEMVLAVALSVTFLFPAVEMVSQVFRSKSELTETFLALSRTFQISPQEQIRKNLESARITLERESNTGLRVFLQYLENSDGLIEALKIKVLVRPEVVGFREISQTRLIERATFVS